jgi:hypothetical protein
MGAARVVTMALLAVGLAACGRTDNPSGHIGPDADLSFLPDARPDANRTPDATPDTPDAMSGAPDAPAGTPDAPAPKPDAPAGTPDAPAPKPDAPAGTPDAMSGMPDAPVSMPDAPVSMADAPVSMPDAPSGTPDAPTSTCGTCDQSMVCCTTPLPCAGMCVPDCRTAGCMDQLTCDTQTGLCQPTMTMSDGGPPPGDGMMMPPTDGMMMPPGDGMMMPPGDAHPPGDGMMMPPGDARAPVDAAMSTPDAAGCSDIPFTGNGVAEARIGATAWTTQYSGNFTGISGNTAAVGYEGSLGTVTGYVTIFVWNSCTSTWDQQQQVVASGATNEDMFGSALALAGDTLVVGANAYQNASDTGIAYTFTRSGTTWTQGPTLAPKAGAGGRFGRAISLSGNTLVVTGPLGKNASSSLTFTGVLSIYTRASTQGNWGYQLGLIPSETEITSGDDLGYSVVVDNGTIVAGAPGNYIWGNPSNTKGKAWVWTGASTTWTETGYLLASDGAVDDWFGKAVGHSGDLILVSAPNKDEGRGAVYVFTLSGGTWTQTAKLTSPNAAVSGWFGFQVAALSETHILVGAAGEGKLYSFTLVDGTWTPDATYSTCDGTVGYTLGVSGNLAISAKPSGAIFDLADPDTSCVP